MLLKVDNISISFGGLKAVDELSFDIKEREIVGLIGPNGAGKTTVFNCITQFYDADTGTVLFNNKNNETVNLNDLKVTNIIKEGLVRTFQNVELVADLSILDNVLIGAHTLYKKGIFSHILKTKKACKEEEEYRSKAIEVLKFMGIDHLKDQYAGGQPYGILKKIGIARTLISDPKLIILDEPAAGLNDVETEELCKLILNIRDKFDISILLVEHDMGFVMNVCDRICAISFGKFLAMDTPENIKNNPIVQEAYLGKDDD
ncbi:ABC transporter ATP-binding protein [Mycoplasmatota bacterium]|nr:ABC transporter ATP-binding protein [Mycoplasmatota bacterium]